jgi:hypothetical protein
LTGLVREFLAIINRMGGGELGYLLLLRYLPELLRRAIQAEDEAGELQIDKPIALYLAEKLGQTASEINFFSSSEGAPPPAPPPPGVSPGSVAHGQWMPSMRS